MHFILFTSSDNCRGWVYLISVCTSSENMNSYLMTMCTSSCSFHLTTAGGGYIWFQCTLHLKIWTHIWCPCALHLTTMGLSVLSICALCYMLNIFGVVVLHRALVNWRRGVLGTCALCYLSNFFGVAVFHTSMVNWRGVHLLSVHVHSAICETSLV